MLTSPLAWPGNQITKPDTLAGYIRAPTGSNFYRGRFVDGIPTGQALNFPDDRYEIFAHAAPALSQALGAQVVAGPFSLNVNLGDAPYSFTSKPSDHSAQFNSDLATRYKYWDRLVEDFGI